MRALPVALVFAAACGSSDPSPPGDFGSDLPDRRSRDAGDGGSGPADSAILDGSGSSTTCTIALDATVAGTVRTSVDDVFKLYVNGLLVKEFTGVWSSPQTDSVTLFRHPSKKNVIAVEGANVQKVPGLDRMIVLDLTFDAGAGEQHVVTDASWVRGPGGLETNWFLVDFAEANWTAATVEGTHGDAPYGPVLGTSSAKYLWSYDSAAADQTTKPDAETVYFRKSFSIGLGGTPQAMPSACP